LPAPQIPSPWNSRKWCSVRWSSKTAEHNWSGEPPPRENVFNTMMVTDSAFWRFIIHPNGRIGIYHER
jgi:hypothetical protein